MNSLSDLWEDAQNTDNPMDSIGYIHNVAVVEIFEYNNVEWNSSIYPTPANLYSSAIENLESKWVDKSAEDFASYYSLSEFSSFWDDLNESNFASLQTLHDLIDNSSAISINSKNALNVISTTKMMLKSC